ncbi:membrane dipeptidase [Bacillus mangrovi]|uniref:Membrane dipeptidase n=1 Tax=Metabacillus mangrovi TaxID=1491830 RepID=A0A7X2V392_9BACI|nr:membrane dipeptidase [Metabacillus mangrovi]MTH51793.1 membrane dipeptidase [Metabacillus mangrovi]
MLKIFDAHCDMLLKLWQNPAADPWDGAGLHTNLKKMVSHGAKIQSMAVFAPPELPLVDAYRAAEAQIQILKDKILKHHPQFKLITSKNQADQLKNDEIGLILALEGCDCLGHQPEKAAVFHNQGVRIFNLTWNYANFFADGALETRNAGLSKYGEKLAEAIGELGGWIDVSHLNERSFWDVLEKGKHVAATHSNCHALMPHPRNLRDSQIQALIERDAPIGITFVPDFTSRQKPSIAKLLLHLEHICSLGGAHHAGFGSDFDGIEETIPGLGGYEEYDHLLNELYKRYPADLADGFVYRNFADRIPF